MNNTLFSSFGQIFNHNHLFFQPSLPTYPKALQSGPWELDRSSGHGVSVLLMSPEHKAKGHAAVPGTPGASNHEKYPGRSSKR